MNIVVRVANRGTIVVVGVPPQSLVALVPMGQRILQVTRVTAGLVQLDIRILFLEAEIVHRVQADMLAQLTPHFPKFVKRDTTVLVFPRSVHRVPQAVMPIGRDQDHAQYAQPDMHALTQLQVIAPTKYAISFNSTS